MLQYAWLVLAFPLVGVLINAFLGYRLGRRLCGGIATVVVALSFLWGLGILADLLGLPAEAREVHLALFDWIAAGDLHVELSLLLDPLSTVMLLVVTGVGALIHLYANGYMGHDPDYARFFTYLNLFIVGMLFLVLADNFLLLYLGWEAVGLCSYLLIGFWYQRKSAADAGKKAFIVNRVGDFGFALGIMLIFVNFQTLGFREVFEAAPATLQAGGAMATAITLLLFTGAVGKSAQLPLYVWLPDAMEGPTPVSALIHAATMVSAGVYLVARMFPLFHAVEHGFAPGVVATIGGFTALFACTIAVAQNDIKRVLAYSTISQLGYMIMALGLGAYVAGAFHLITHAFFKALLFLASGSVIVGAHHEQDMMEMGGLRGRMKITFWTYIVGTLALAGIPPLAGFWSKDEILADAFSHGHYLAWAAGSLAAFLTAFYMGRQIFLVFWGEPRSHHAEHAHESPPTMVYPLMVLAFFAAILGFAGVPEDFPLLGGLLGNPFHHFVGHEFQAVPVNYLVMGLSVLLGCAGLGVGYLVYGRSPLKAHQPDPLTRLGWLHTCLQKAYGIDPLYRQTFVRGTILLGDVFAVVDRVAIDGVVNAVARGAALLSQGLFRFFDLPVIDGLVDLVGRLGAGLSELWGWFDLTVIDGIVNALGTLAQGAGRLLRGLQTGRVQSYLFVASGMTVVLLVFYLIFMV